MFFKYLKKIKIEIIIITGFIISRAPGLGYYIFNTDIRKWEQRIYDFGSGVFYLDFAKTLQKYHPGVTLMWLGTIAVKIHNFIYEVFYGMAPPDDNVWVIFQLHALQKYMIVIAIAFTLAFIYHGIERAVNNKVALTAVILIALEPFYIALTRVVHLEGLLSTFMLASGVWFYLYIVKKNLSKRGRKELIISAVFAALAILTKTSSLILLPFMGLALFVNYFAKNKQDLVKNFGNSLKLSVLDYLPWLGVVIAVFIALWPAMWVTPIKVLEALFSGVYSTGIDQGHLQLYLGRWVSDPGPLFYPVVLVLRSSLYVLAGLVILPFIFRKLNKKEKPFVIYIFLFGLIYLIEMTIPSKKLDRYLLPTIISFGVLAGIVVNYLSGLISEKINKVGRNWILGLLLVPALAFAVWLHPNYFAYYNPLTGGLKKGIWQLEPKWAFGQDKLVEYFEQVKKEDNLEGFGDETLQSLYYSDELDNKLTVAFQEKYYTQFRHFPRMLDGWATIESLSEDAKQTNYFVYPVWDIEVTQENDFELEYRDSIYVQGVEIYRVYNRLDK